MFFVILIQFILKKFLPKMGASTIFSLTKEEWKCVLTPGVTYFIIGLSRNSLTKFNNEFFTSKQRQTSNNYMPRHQWFVEFN
jgi:hypothetical protein